MGAAGMGLMKGGGVCKNVAGLTKAQLEVCHRNPDVTLAAIHGLQMAVKECQHQFRWHRWNCSNLSTKNRNPQSSIILKRGKTLTLICFRVVEMMALGDKC
jgi:wingless-type MMTV integration site family protein 10